MEKEYLLIKKTTALIVCAVMFVAMCLALMIFGITNACKPIPISSTYTAKRTTKSEEVYEKVVIKSHDTYELVITKNTKRVLDFVGKYRIEGEDLFLYDSRGILVCMVKHNKELRVYDSNENYTVYKSSGDWLSVVLMVCGAICGTLAFGCLYSYKRNSMSAETKRKKIEKLQKQLDDLNNI